MKRLSSLILCLLILISASVSVLAAPKENAAENALTYYKSAFEKNFSLGAESPDYMTADVWTSYIAKSSGNWENSDYAFMKQKNYAPVTASAGELAKSLLLCALYEEDFTASVPASLIKALEAKQKDTGAFSDYISEHTWAVAALEIVKRNGGQVSYNAGAAAAYFESKQKTDGGFNDYDNVGNVDTTGMAIIALKSMSASAAGKIMDKAVGFLQASLNDKAFFLGKGTYDSVNSCSQSYGIIGLIAAGEDPTSAKWSAGGRSAADALLDFADKDGGFWYDLDSKNGTGFFKAPDAFSTSQALMALLDLENGSLWAPKTEIVPSTTLPATTTAKAPAVSPDDTDNPATGEKPINPVLIVVIVLAAAALVVTVIVPLIKKKK